jgi:hypothetical protein
MHPPGATPEIIPSSTPPPPASAPAAGKLRRLAGPLAAGLALLLSGCATPGPGHAYLHSPTLGPSIQDFDPADGAERAALYAHLVPGERILGLAYEPFTDHLFVRLHPGNRVRVIDRPARALKRAFAVPELAPGGHDLAVRSRDRHVFFTDPSGPALLETDLYGKLERRLSLEGLDAPPWGVAHDPRRDELLVLAAEISDRVHRFDPLGRARGEVTLSAPVRGRSLGYDADARELFASLADGSAIGVFDAEGRLLRRLPRPHPDEPVFVDIGPRSLLRLF